MKFSFNLAMLKLDILSLENSLHKDLLVCKIGITLKEGHHWPTKWLFAGGPMIAQLGMLAW